MGFICLVFLLARIPYFQPGLCVCRWSSPRCWRNGSADFNNPELPTVLSQFPTTRSHSLPWVSVTFWNRTLWFRLGSTHQRQQIIRSNWNAPAPAAKASRFCAGQAAFYECHFSHGCSVGFSWSCIFNDTIIIKLQINYRITREQNMEYMQRIFAATFSPKM